MQANIFYLLPAGSGLAGPLTRTGNLRSGTAFLTLDKKSPGIDQMVSPFGVIFACDAAPLGEQKVIQIPELTKDRSGRDGIVLKSA
jgi:hypothetical protein